MAARKRSQLDLLLGQLRKGDAVVVTKLDRPARSTAELLRIAKAINKKAQVYSHLMNHGQTPRRPPAR